MRKLLIPGLLLALFLCSPAFAGWNGEVWVSQIGGDEYPANPGFSSAAEYTGGLEIGYTWDLKVKIRPYLRIDTLMDERLNSTAIFHAAGIQFYNGLEVSYKDFFIEYQHLCWHPVDTGGEVWQYDMIKIGFRFGDR